MSPTAQTLQPNKVAIAVDMVITNDKGQILLGKRLAAAGYGTWGLPGGHVIDGEALFDTAKREIREELGDKFLVDFQNEIVAVRDNCLPPYFLRHVTVVITGKYIAGEAIINEPDHCAGWGWFDPDKLPEPLFSGIGEVIACYRDKKASIV